MIEIIKKKVYAFIENIQVKILVSTPFLKFKYTKLFIFEIHIRCIVNI